MVVTKNCKIRLNGHNNITLVDLKKVVETEVYSNLNKLLKVALTIAVSSATCERSFSAIKIIKNWMRYSKKIYRLNYYSYRKTDFKQFMCWRCFKLFC